MRRAFLFTVHFSVSVHSSVNRDIESPLLGFGGLNDKRNDHIQHSLVYNKCPTKVISYINQRLCSVIGNRVTSKRSLKIQAYFFFKVTSWLQNGSYCSCHHNYIVGILCFVLYNFKISFHCLLASVICDEKSAIICTLLCDF